MRLRDFLGLAALVMLLVTGAVAQLSDHPGFKDPAMFTRMPNFFLSNDDSFTDVPFDGHDFTVTVKDSLEPRKVEGHYMRWIYVFDDSRGVPRPSPLQVVRNYQSAARKIGGEILYEDKENTTIRFARNGQETWVSVDGYHGITIEMIEKQAMQQDVGANVAGLLDGLKQSGHVEVPGILFDFGKSEVKPESEAALKEVAKLMQENPQLKVWVVGHTDNVGSAESNVTLSKARAASVVTYLTQKLNVAGARLSPFGAGPYAPKASNESEDGRAQNRRVELVAQP